VIGMGILFCFLMARKKMPENLEKVAGVLHHYLPLMFVPAGVGIITNVSLLKRSWAPIAGAIVVGTVVTIAVTGVVMSSLHRGSVKIDNEANP